MGTLTRFPLSLDRHKQLAITTGWGGTPSFEAPPDGGRTTEPKGPRSGSRKSARTAAEDESGILGRLGSCLGSANCAVACKW